MLDSPPLVQRVLDGAMACVSRWGPSKTTLEDIAREAGCSRATVYRLFPGGKDSLLRALTLTEVSRFFDAIDVRLRQATTLENLLTAGIAEALTRLGAHPALQYLLQHEVASLVPGPSSDAMRQVIDSATGFTAERLAGWVPAGKVAPAADWVVRVTLSYALSPPDADHGAVHEDWVRALVRDLLLPAMTDRSATTPSRS